MSFDKQGEKNGGIKFIPNAIATGIGSLPHNDPKEACQLIWDLMPEIPFWPQLPKRSPLENMYYQYAENMPGFIAKKEGGFYIDEGKEGFYKELETFYQAFISHDLEYFRISKKYASGLYHWLEGKEHLKFACGIKGQITGPVSFGLQVTQQDKRSILYNDTLKDVMTKQLLGKAQWQVALMKQIHPNPIIFLDEPYLSAFGSAFTSIDRDTVMALFREFFSTADSLTGIHCCGNTDWSLILDSKPDILSFDTYSYGDSLFLYEESLTRFLKQGGIIAWGIVPTNESDIIKETAESLIARLEKAWEKLSLIGFDEKTILAQSIITPACGLGSSPKQAAVKAFQLTKQISERIRIQFDLV
jgi:methionine synthase II (cobalamin-independent)